MDESGEGDDDVSDEEENPTGRGKARPRVNGVPTKVKLSSKKSYVQPGELGGGPTNETVLKSFREHVAHAIWVGHETKKVIKLQYHHRKFKQWKFEDECERFKTLYLSSGISELSRATFSTVDNVLATTLIERWHPETNAFHLPFGEMTITLDDVKHIVDVPVTGKPLVGNQSFGTLTARSLLETLGVTKAVAEETLKGSTMVLFLNSSDFWVMHLVMF